LWEAEDGRRHSSFARLGFRCRWTRPYERQLLVTPATEYHHSNSPKRSFVFSSVNCDYFRLVGLACLGLIAVRQWLKNSQLRRGRHLTVQLLVRMVVSAVAGLSFSLLAFAVAERHFSNIWLSIPTLPGFFVGAVTVGVHRDDNLLAHVTVVLNAALYGTIVFACYPLLRRIKSLPR